MEENMVVIKESKTFNFNFDWHKDVNRISNMKLNLSEKAMNL